MTDSSCFRKSSGLRNRPPLVLCALLIVNELRGREELELCTGTECRARGNELPLPALLCEHCRVLLCSTSLQLASEGRAPFHFSALLLLVKKNLGFVKFIFIFCGHSFQTSSLLPLGLVSTASFVFEAFHDS